MYINILVGYYFCGMCSDCRSWGWKWRQVAKFAAGAVVHPGKGDSTRWTLWLLNYAGAHCGAFSVVLLWVVPSILPIFICSVGNMFRKHNFSLTPKMLIMSMYLYYCGASGVVFTAERIRAINHCLYSLKQERNMVGIERSLQKAHNSHYCWRTSQHNRWILK